MIPPTVAPTCELECEDSNELRLGDTDGLEVAVGLDVLEGSGLAVDSGLSEVVETRHAAFSCLRRETCLPPVSCAGPSSHKSTAYAGFVSI